MVNVPIGYGSFTVKAFHLALHKISAGVGIAALKIFTNALNTSRRYRNKSSHGQVFDCVFCGHLEGDHIWHLLSCPVVRTQMAMRWYRIGYPCDEDKAKTFFLLLDRPPTECVIERFVIADIVVKAYQSVHKGLKQSVFLDRVITERMSHWFRGDKTGKYRETIEAMNRKHYVRPAFELAAAVTRAGEGPTRQIIPSQSEEYELGIDGDEFFGLF